MGVGGARKTPGLGRRLWMVSGHPAGLGAVDPASDGKIPRSGGFQRGYRERRLAREKSHLEDDDHTPISGNLPVTPAALTALDVDFSFFVGFWCFWMFDPCFRNMLF